MAGARAGADEGRDSRRALTESVPASHRDCDVAVFAPFAPGARGAGAFQRAPRRDTAPCISTVVVCGMLAAAALALGAGAAPAGAARPSRTSVPGSVPRWAQPSRDRGDAASTKPVTVTVYLPLRDADAADALAQQVSDPASAHLRPVPDPRRRPAALRRQRRDVAAVSSFLRGAGLTVGDVADQQPLRRGDRHAREGRGRLRHATYTATPSAGEVLRRAEQRRCRSPSSSSDKVLAVTGLDQSGTLTRPQQGDLPGATTGGDAERRAPRQRGHAARRRPTRSSTRRRARRTSARRSRASTRRSTARRSRSRRAATRRRSTRAPTAPRALSPRASTAAA